MFHDPALWRSLRWAIVAIFAVMFALVALLPGGLANPLTWVFVILLVLVALFVLAGTHVPREAQTRWADNYSTRILLDPETVRVRAEKAFARAGLSYTTVAKPQVTGYCVGSDYVLWLRVGAVGLWI